jgi:SulP family sulfate permease
VDRLHPITQGRPATPRAAWLGDLAGGITSGVVALPLALAFAIASGVEPKAGLYTAIVAGIVASLVGGSPLQITGPTGAMAVVLVGVVAQYGLEQVWVAGLMAGVILIALGVCRLGRSISLLPLPVIAGFTAGIGVIIFVGQLGNAFGIKVPLHATGVMAQMVWHANHFGQVNVATVMLTVFVIGIKVAAGRFKSIIPGSLIALVAATALASWLKLDVARIGSIPAGLPWPVVPRVLWSSLPALIHPALALAALGAIESLLSATVADRLSGGKKHDPDRELIGQGVANLVVPFFGGIPCTGAIARTAVNIRAGARTRWSGVVHGLFIALVLVVLGPVAAQVPLAALAGVLMVVSVRMIEWEQIKLIKRSTKSDFAVLVLTCCVTIFFDLVTAVEVGLAAAALFFIRRMADVHVISHSQVPVASGLPAELTNDIGVIDVDRPLFFGDAHRLEEIVLADQHRAIVLRLSVACTMDVTAAMVLLDMHRELDQRGVRLALSDVAPEVYALLERLGILAALGPENVFLQAEEAVAAIANDWLAKQRAHPMPA